MKGPLVSIIIPVYNVEKYLSRCIDSVISQTYKNIEIILVDDESSDSCPSICDHYASLDNRVRVIHKKNGGLSAARNAGLKVAAGDWIGFVDSDDWIDPDTYETAVNVAIKYGVEIVQWNLVVFYDNGNEEKMVIPLEEGYCDFKENIPLHWVFNTAYTKLYKKNLFSLYDIQYPVGVQIIEDVSVSYRLFSNLEKIFYLNRCFYHYFQREDSILHASMREEQIDSAVQELKYISGYIEKRRHYDILNKSLDSRKLELKNKYIFNLKKPNYTLWRETFPETMPELKDAASLFFLLVEKKLDFIADLALVIRRKLR